MLCAIPAGQIEAIWPQVEPWLEAVEQHCHGKITVASVREKLAAETAQLWVWLADGAPIAVALTEILHFPKCKSCRIWVATGVDRHVWLRAGLAAIEEWARLEGCTLVEPMARPGWEKELHTLGYRTQHVELVKEL